VEKGDYMRIANANLQYYMHVPDPDSLTDEEWAMKLRELEWIRDIEAKGNVKSRI
jgi:hypothetical protein